MALTTDTKRPMAEAAAVKDATRLTVKRDHVRDLVFLFLERTIARIPATTPSMPDAMATTLAMAYCMVRAWFWMLMCLSTTPCTRAPNRKFT